MPIVHQSAFFSSSSPPVSVLLLPAPPKHRALPAPRIAGYLPAPRLAVSLSTPKKVVSATIANPLILIDDPQTRWDEFQRIHGTDRSREEMDAELDAIWPGYVAHMREKVQRMRMADGKAAS